MSLEMQDQQAEVQHNVKDTAEVDNCNDASSDDDDDYDSVPQKYLNLEFDVCFHEHQKTKIFGLAHKVLGIVYKWIKIITYHVFAFVIGVPLMIIWALLSGITAFVYSWIWSPVLRVAIFWLAAILPLITVPIIIMYKPLVDVTARIFRQIQIKANLNGQLYGQTQVV